MVGEKKDVGVSQGLSPADGDGHHRSPLLAINVEQCDHARGLH